MVDHTLADPRSLIVFSDQDLVGVRNLHYDAVVIAIQIGDYTVRKVMIDGSSGADILFYPAFFALLFPIAKKTSIRHRLPSSDSTVWLRSQSER